MTYTYIFIAIIIVSLLLFMGLLFKRKTTKSTISEINKKDIVKYLLKNHPYINFDVSKLNVSSSDDIFQEKIFIVEDLATQFGAFQKDIPNSAPTLDHNYLWSTYLINSKPKKDRTPPDIKKRKEALLYRDKHICYRCGKNINFSTQKIFYLKAIEDGGDYSFENMLSMCNDCNKILLTNDVKKTVRDLELTDKLYTII